VAFEVQAGGAPTALDAMRALGIDAYSVTMPHKEAVAAAVDHLSADARRLAAVNCVTRDGELLTGHNTDGPGFVRALVDETGFAPSGARCVVVGAGGAARAVVLALSRAGAAEVVVVNRTPARGEAAAALAGPVGRLGGAAELRAADLVVDATPAGMAGHDPLAVDPDLLGPATVVADLVYHPATTPLLTAARERGLVAVNGLGMLVHQAAIQFELATGSEAPIEVMVSAARRALDAR
jgi:shikimate dehydrogenase